MTTALSPSSFASANPRVIHWGRGAIAQLAPELERLQVERVALLTTKSLLGHGEALKVNPMATVVISQHAPMSEIDAGDKAGLRDPRLLAEAVIYDAELTLATPMDLWLSTGIRALDHAVEGFLAPGEHPFNDAMALDSIGRLFDSLPRAKASPRDVDVRTENQLAAWFSFTLPGASAGGLSHTMGKQIGARHGIPHGVTSCLLVH